MNTEPAISRRFTIGSVVYAKAALLKTIHDERRDFFVIFDHENTH